MVGTLITLLALAYFINGCMNKSVATCKLQAHLWQSFVGTGYQIDNNR